MQNPPATGRSRIVSSEYSFALQKHSLSRRQRLKLKLNAPPGENPLHLQPAAVATSRGKMIRTLAIILCTAGLSIYYADLENESAFFSIVLPIVLVISLISLALWLVTLFHKKAIGQTTRPNGGGMDFFGGGDGGGDGG